MFEKATQTIGLMFKKDKTIDRPIGRDKNGVEIWNRSMRNFLGKIFTEDRSAHGLGDQNPIASREHQSYYFTPANTEFDPDPMNASNEIITVDSPIASLKECFRDGAVVLELACGGGEAARGLAKKFPNTKIHAIDHEWGQTIPVGEKPTDNLEFHNMSWNELQFPDDSIDTILSVQGVGRYGVTDQAVAEITRVAKQGALLRVDKDRGIIGVPEISDLLAEYGWDIYHLKSDQGPTHVIIGKLVSKELLSE